MEVNSKYTYPNSKKFNNPFECLFKTYQPSYLINTISYVPRLL